MKLLVYLFLLSSIISCTVTKRQHRPGYHIEWKRNYAKSNTDSEPTQQKNSFNTTLETRAISKVENSHTPQLIDQRTVEASDSDIPDEPHSEELMTISELTNENTESGMASTPKHQKARAIYFNDASIENMRKAGWVIMGIGLFLFICVLIASAPWITSATSIAQFLLYIIFGLLGLLLILLFGPVGAFIFTLCLAAAGVIIALIAMSIQRRRKRYSEIN